MYNANDLELTSCPLCMDPEYSVVIDAFSPFKVVRCKACSMHYLSPRLNETSMLKTYGADEYFASAEMGYDNYGEQERSLRATFHHLMKTLSERDLTGGDLLEVGCGHGYLLHEAKNFFTKIVGTDFSPQAVAKASERADHVYCGGIEQIPAEDKYDCIILNQVIEHVYHPKELLMRLREHLRPFGKIIVATPDMGSFWRHVMGRRWPSFKIPEHILYFDKGTLTALMEHIGLTKINQLPYPHAFPLSLVAAKFRLRMPHALGKINIWFPATTIAMVGVSNGK